ncbi:MAG: hypothetical protein JST80_02190 [Bdellovibrionales bacterium]|nr:hypothetical protein [Bdellovibrionales bacterium]
MEKVLYELRPYAFSLIGLISMVMANGSQMRLASGALLLLAAIFIIRKRYLNRANIRYF